MKKFLYFMVVAMVVLLPFSVKAEEKIIPNCTKSDDGLTYSCSVSVSLDTAADTLNISLTERGGAVINTITEAENSEWTLTKTYDSTNKVHNLILTSPDEMKGEYSLFNFTYEVSGTEECGVAISFDGKTITSTPEEPTPNEPTPDKPEEDKQTGATLPYIALGSIALIAAGAYVVTKNKSKMYKI